jgi:sRNA-binding regulator protein Hfq
MNTYRIIFLQLVMILISNLGHTQIDSLIFFNGDAMVGEIKSMDRGVVIVETDYSDIDFQIEWEFVKEIYTESQFLITLYNDIKYYGKIRTSEEFQIQIHTEENNIIPCTIEDIVYLSPIKDRFIDRLSASIDIGIDMAKSNNLRSLTSRSFIGYKSNKWSSDLSLSYLYSRQDETEDIIRTESALTYRHILPFKFYAIGTISTLSNTEQKLDLRMNAQLGLGHFLVRTIRSYWGLKLGFNKNIEQYSNEAENRNSWEGYMGTELNLFDIGDFRLLVILMGYPGITEKGRWRSDSKLDIKYDLPLNLYISMGISFNYDNRPAEGASKTDYVLKAGFGWEW